QHIAEELGQLDIGGEPATTPEIIAPEPLAAPRVEDDGIAIVGMACRLPGAKNLSEYWNLLMSGVDAVTDGRSKLRIPGSDAGDEDASNLRGGFVEDIEWFDSRFFRISPIEARIMDPQQRMMLETSWEALEDAGIDPETVRGSLTGVFAGISGSEYRDLMKDRMSGGYLGTAASVTVGRVAFALGLEGPALPIDMACASSLAAIHQAVGSLRRGEVNLALAGGAHATLSRQIADFMTELGLLSRSGQCSPFDASADGYVRGEGCGIIVLKRLSEAEADGDRIWGVIRGSAVNQNGASAGLTVPNGPAEERVMEAALAQTSFEGSDIDYLEAHATGSQLGDAIEMRAVGAVYGRGRDADNPLLVGTVKSNIGHLEPAAGIAGVIKTALAMKHRVIPKHLHFKNPNPEIDWDQYPVRVTSTQTEWPLNPQRPPRAAVSAFGISGANAHIILEGYENSANSYDEGFGIRSLAGSPQQIPTSLPESVGDMRDGGAELTEREARLLPLSGKSEGAVRDLAKQYLFWLDERADVMSSESGSATVLADMAWTAGTGRSHFAHRAGLPFKDVPSLKDALRTLAEAGIDADAPPPQPATRVTFLYTGDAIQWADMGRKLYDTEPIARAVLDFCDSVASQVRGSSLLDVMLGGEGGLDDPAWAQPGIYSLESAMTALWSDIGICPDVVLGHGLGEISAAQTAGVFSLEDGMRLSLARGEFMAKGSDLDRLQSTLASVQLTSPTTTLMSGVTGKLAEADALMDTSYWIRQADETPPSEVRTSALADLGTDVIIEIGPGFVKAVAKAYEAGLPISFEGMFTGETRRRISLPTYPFQRRRHWI
ncbi:MAG: type I polyketide synthase, partial [Dehalococcoidia bacterium]|nr:type I polyketide synthase [Dehalococcoidia bacterium]